MEAGEVHHPAQQPAGEEGWFQRYPLETHHLLKDEARFVLASGGGEIELKLGEDWVVRGFDGEGLDLSAGVVFAGHGLADATLGLDQFAGLDVRGRWVLVLDGRPLPGNRLPFIDDGQTHRVEAQLPDGRALELKIASVGR